MTSDLNWVSIHVFYTRIKCIHLNIIRMLTLSTRINIVWIIFIVFNGAIFPIFIIIMRIIRFFFECLKYISNLYNIFASFTIEQSFNFPWIDFKIMFNFAFKSLSIIRIIMVVETNFINCSKYSVGYFFHCSKWSYIKIELR